VVGIRFAQTLGSEGEEKRLPCLTVSLRSAGEPWVSRNNCGPVNSGGLAAGWQMFIYKEKIDIVGDHY
jgi:hypothetical protein